MATKRINITLPRDLLDQAQVYGRLNGISLSGLIRDLLKREIGDTPVSDNPDEKFFEMLSSERAKEIIIGVYRNVYQDHLPQTIKTISNESIAIKTTDDILKPKLRAGLQEIDKDVIKVLKTLTEDEIVEKTGVNIRTVKNIKQKIENPIKKYDEDNKVNVKIEIYDKLAKLLTPMGKL